MAVDFLRNGFSLELRTLAFCLDASITLDIFDIFHHLRAEFISLYDCVKLLFVGIDSLGVNASALNVDEICGIGASVLSLFDHFFFSDSD